MSTPYATIPPMHSPKYSNRKDWGAEKNPNGFQNCSVLTRIAKKAQKVYSRDTNKTGFVCSADIQKGWVSTVKLTRGASSCRFPDIQASVTIGFCMPGVIVSVKHVVTDPARHKW